jgi:hypothetical protein
MNRFLPIAFVALAVASPTDEALAGLERVGAFVVHGVEVAADVAHVAMHRPAEEVAPGVCAAVPVFEAGGRIVGLRLAAACAIR